MRSDVPYLESHEVAIEWLETLLPLFAKIGTTTGGYEGLGFHNLRPMAGL
jgi:hypothetical protein